MTHTEITARWPIRRSAALAAFSVVLLAGLWVSFHYSLSLWRADADVCVTIELWRGVLKDGLRFTHSWGYTQDNWLLSLIPIASLIYDVFGATPRVAILIGWGFFVASAALTAWLTAQVSGRVGGAITGCVLLFAGVWALGPAGYLSYPISHNISMAWGLLVLALAYGGIERGSVALCAAACVAIFIDAVSDPWAGAAVAIPVILASGAIAALNRDKPALRYALGICAGAAVAFWAAETRAFGALRFLPKSDVQFGDLATLLSNIGWLYRSVGAIFNIVPGATLEAVAPRRLSVAAVAVVVVAACAATLLRLRRQAPARQFIGLAAILSLVTTGLAFMVGRWGAGLLVGRFFPNLYFLGALLLATAAAQGWRSWPRLARLGLCAYVFLFALSGVMSDPHAWLSKPPPSQPEEPARFAAFLEAHGLSYGYGPFWGSGSLSMQALSQGRVIIRPVSFQGGRIARRSIETSTRWFTPSAEPAGRPIFLVIQSDGEECPSISRCEDLARRQFGPPDDRLAYDAGLVLIWRKALVPMMAVH
jgi:hypothetical protein